jgi:hypothetical protein
VDVPLCLAADGELQQQSQVRKERLEACDLYRRGKAGVVQVAGELTRGAEGELDVQSTAIPLVRPAPRHAWTSCSAVLLTV